MIRRIALIGALLFAATAAHGQDTLTVGTKLAPPFVIENDRGEVSGISIELWEQLAADLDLDFEYRRTDLDGLLDGLQNGELDVAVGALTMTAAREQVLDFTHPFHTSGMAVAVPEGGAGWWVALGRFVSYEFFMAVLALLGVLLAVGFVVWLFERRANAEEFGGSAPRGLGSGLWWAAVTMTTVGYGDKAPRTLGGRIVGLVWMFAAIIIISGFTAAIATSLTVGQLDSRIKGIDDLRDVRVATVARATSGEALNARGIAFTPEKTVAAALDALAAGEVDAVVYDAPILRYLANDAYEQRVRVLPFRFDPQEYGLALPEGSRLREPLNRRILEIINGAEWPETLARYLGDRR